MYVSACMPGGSLYGGCGPLLFSCTSDYISLTPSVSCPPMQGRDKLSVKRGRGEKGRKGRRGEEREDTVSGVSYALPDTDLARSRASKKTLSEP